MAWSRDYKTTGKDRLANIEDGVDAVSNGGSIPITTSSVTRDSQGRITAFVNPTGSYTVAYDVSTGLVSTISNGTTTRTISRDTSGLVTGVA